MIQKFYFYLQESYWKELEETFQKFATFLYVK